MNPDVPTMAMMAATASAAVGASMLWLACGRAVDGLKAWGAAVFLHGGALVLLGLRGRVPDVLSIVGGNVLLSATLAAAYLALCRFHARIPNRLVTIAPVVVTAAAFSALLDHFALRVTVGSTIWSLQSLAVVVLAVRERPRQGCHGHQLVAIGFATMAAVFVARGAAFGSGAAAAATFLSPHPLQTLVYVASLVALLLASYGFMGMIRERADEQNRRLAMEDALTGIANRRALLDAFGRALAEARRAGAPLSLLMIDADRFKSINDAHGHVAGDAVLRGIVDVIRERVRGGDALGRYGGEEFMVVLPGTDVAGAVAIAEALCARVREHAFVVDGVAIPVTVSIGVHGVDAGAHATVDDLVRGADAALYRAKADGRDRVRFDAPAVPGGVAAGGRAASAASA